MTGPCVRHPDRLAVKACASCQRAACEQCCSERDGEGRCPACANLGIPWEQRGRNPVAAYLKTAAGALFGPDKLFRSLAPSLAPPHVPPPTLGTLFRYDLITQYIASSVPTVVTALSFESPFTVALLRQVHFTLVTPHQLAVGSLLLYPLTAPLLALFNLCLAWLMHATLRVLGAVAPDGGGFRRTYAAMAYGSSPSVLNATVFLSWLFIPQLWNAFSTIAALRHAHGISNAKATAAVLAPELILLVILFASLGVYFLRGLQTVLGDQLVF